MSPWSEPLLPPPEVPIEETRLALVWLEEDGILRVGIRPASVASVADAEETLEAARRVVGSRRCPCLADIRQILSTDRASRVFFQDRLDLPVTAVAMLVGSSLSRTIGNFFLGIGRLTLPARLFTSEAEALAWLEAYRTSATE